MYNKQSFLTLKVFQEQSIFNEKSMAGIFCTLIAVVVLDFIAYITWTGPGSAYQKEQNRLAYEAY